MRINLLVFLLVLLSGCASNPSSAPALDFRSHVNMDGIHEAHVVQFEADGSVTLLP